MHVMRFFFFTQFIQKIALAITRLCELERWSILLGNSVISAARIRNDKKKKKNMCTNCFSLRRFNDFR